MNHKINWLKVFEFDTPLLEIIVRGSIMYLALFALLRIVLRRESADVSKSDTLVIVLLADAAQNGMAGNYTSVPDGILLVAVIIGWSHLLNFLGYHSKFFQRLLAPSKLMIIKDGKLLRRSMRKELITIEELMTEIRKHGYDDISEIKACYMESDGNFSFIDETKDNVPKNNIPAKP
jgi:uncharacterized membrane protein YcaP (DUF421 family)